MNRQILVVGLAVLLLAACSAPDRNIGVEAVVADEVAYAAPAPAPQAKRMMAGNAAARSAAVEQKITRSAGISFQTRSVEQTKAYVAEIVERMGGLIDSENTNSYNDRLNCWMQVRVPAGKLDTFLTAIESGAMRVESKSVSQDDVTTRYIDLDTQLRNKRALEARYQALLDKAVSVGDLLSLEREMTQIRTDIESTEKQLAYLEQQVEYSTCSINFFEQKAVDIKESGSLVGNALKDGGQYFVNSLLFIIKMWPFLLLAAVIAVLVVWRRKRHG